MEMHVQYPEKFKLITRKVEELKKLSYQVDTKDEAAILMCRELARKMQEILILDPAQPLNRQNILGYGLSARQLVELEGKESPRLSVVILPGTTKTLPGTAKIPTIVLKMINPQILKTSKPWRYKGEGCLSFPGLYHNTSRYWACTVGFIDADTLEPREMDFGATEAVVMQHELDHHDGKVFLEYARIPITRNEEPGPNDPCPLCANNGKTLKWKKCLEHNR